MAQLRMELQMISQQIEMYTHLLHNQNNNDQDTNNNNDQIHQDNNQDHNQYNLNQSIIGKYPVLSSIDDNGVAVNAVILEDGTVAHNHVMFDHETSHRQYQQQQQRYESEHKSFEQSQLMEVPCMPLLPGESFSLPSLPFLSPPSPLQLEPSPSKLQPPLPSPLQFELSPPHLQPPLPSQFQPLSPPQLEPLSPLQPSLSHQEPLSPLQTQQVMDAFSTLVTGSVPYPLPTIKFTPHLKDTRYLNAFKRLKQSILGPLVESPEVLFMNDQLQTQHRFHYQLYHQQQDLQLISPAWQLHHLAALAIGAQNEGDAQRAAEALQHAIHISAQVFVRPTLDSIRALCLLSFCFVCLGLINYASSFISIAEKMSQRLELTPYHPIMCVLVYLDRVCAESTLEFFFIAMQAFEKAEKILPHLPHQLKNTPFQRFAIMRRALPSPTFGEAHFKRFDENYSPDVFIILREYEGVLLPFRNVRGRCAVCDRKESHDQLHVQDIFSELLTLLSSSTCVQSTKHVLLDKLQVLDDAYARLENIAGRFAICSVKIFCLFGMDLFRPRPISGSFHLFHPDTIAVARETLFLSTQVHPDLLLLWAYNLLFAAFILIKSHQLDLPCRLLQIRVYLSG